MGCNVLHGALLLLFIATLTAVRGLPVEGQSSPSSCSPHLLTPNGNGSEMEVDIYTYYRSGYPGCLGIFLSNMFNSKRGGHALNELVLKKEDGALMCNGFVRLLSLIDGYGLTPKMCDGKALANEQREFCTKTYAVKKAQISELASRLDEIGVSRLSDAARVVSSLDDHCEDICDGIFNSALCGGFVDAGLFFMANYDTAVKNKVGSGTESELGEQQGTTETEQPSLKSGEGEKATTQLDSQSTVRTEPAQGVPTIQPSQQEPQQSSQPPQKPQISQDDIAMSLLKSSDVKNPPDDKAPGDKVPSQSRYQQTNMLPQDGGQEAPGGEKILAGSEKQLPPDQGENEQQTPEGSVSEQLKVDQSQEQSPPVVETPTAEDDETPAAEDAETPAAEDAETPAAEDAGKPAAEDDETPAAEDDETSPAEGETPPAEDVETPAAEDAETPPAEDVETPPAEDVETPPAEDVETPAAEDDETERLDDDDDDYEEESNTEYEESVYDDSLYSNETEEALEKEIEELFEEYEEEYEEEYANMDGEPASKKPSKPKGKTQMVGEIYASDEEKSSKSSGGHGSWHFFTIFLFVAILSIVGYLCVYNRKKIGEGVSSYMSDKNRRRRGREYKPLLSAQT